MAVYSVDDIKKDVRIAMDYNMDSSALTSIGNPDTLSLEEIIESKIVKAVQIIHTSAPAHLLRDCKHETPAVGSTTLPLVWNPDPTRFDGYIAIDNTETLMRLVVFRMSDWERDVYDVHTKDDAEYNKQFSRYKGIRGTPQKPICIIDFITNTNTPPSVKRILRFYSCKSQSAVSDVYGYLPYPSINSGTIEICKLCYNAVIYTIASLVALTLGDKEKSTIFDGLAQTSLV